MSKPPSAPGNLSPDKQALLTLRRLRARVEELERAQSEPIAVVGLGCRFPGGASSPDAYWDLLHRGTDGISEVPVDRWDIEQYYDRNPDAPGKMSTRWGGWVPNPDRFDAQFFGIAPREAASLDPQQRMLLEVAWESLEHAAIAPQSLAGTEAGVFIGISTSDYGQFQLRHCDQSETDAYFGTGNAINAAAGRLSYVLGLVGPSLSVDTACSSSLVAVHLACESLRRRESSLAIAGGVNFILLPELTINFSRAHMMAVDGRCKTFDAAADGYVRGEGCGIVVLKRLSDARANGDRVLAIVRGSAVNQDGRSGGFTAPSELSQQALIRRALAQAAVEPAAIGYVEAHGTGTSLGDPIEIQALGAVLGANRSAADHLWVGSAKTNIGHLEAAAGVAGLIKVVLSFQHDEIPPHLHFSNPNPYIPWDDLPIRVPTSPVPWPGGARRRLAGVSSFGFTGTNAHIVLEEPPSESPAEPQAAGDQILCLSAKNDAALASLAASYAERLKSGIDSFEDVCFTACAGRSHFNERLAVVGSTASSVAGDLDALAAQGRPSSLVRGTAPTSGQPDVAFLFTGQGSHYAGMGRQLYEGEPAFRDAFDRCAEILNGHFDRPLTDLVFTNDDSALDDTSRAQPALFAVEYALAELWRCWGVTPAFVLGHSLGEYVAACVAGVFSLSDALKLVARRGQAMGMLPRSGAMVALLGEPEQLARITGSPVPGIAVAAVNAPDEIVLAGEAAAIDALVARCEGEAVRVQRLATSHAFHSPLIEPALEGIERTAREISYRAPRIGLASNLTGEIAAGDLLATPDYWRRHARETVRFADGLRAVAATGCRVFLEIGPKPTLAALGRRTLGDDAFAWVPSMIRGRDERRQMLDALAALYVRGVNVEWTGAPRGARRVSLPTYPFQRERHWVEIRRQSGTVSNTQIPAAVPDRSSISDWLYDVVWEPQASPRAASWIDASATTTRSDTWVRELLAPDALRDQGGVKQALEDLSLEFVVAALTELGWTPRAGELVDEAALAGSLGIAAQYRRLFARLLSMLAEDGMLARHGSSWKVIRPFAPVDAPAKAAQIRAMFPDITEQLAFVERCGLGLGRVLTGAVNALDLLFPNGSSAQAEHIYRDSPLAKAFNTLLARTVADLTSRLTPGGQIRILELGAGTGGSSSFVFPVLPPDRTVYVFSDIAKLFLTRAEERFSAYPFVRYSPLNIETDPSEQGFDAGQFDIVIAANVVHATRDLSTIATHIKKLLAPGGVLLLLEATEPLRWVDLTFGTTEGWWRFADLALRPAHPLLSRSQWLAFLRGEGFEDVAAIPGNEVAPEQTLVIARRPPTETSPQREWVFLADSIGIADAAARELHAAGEGVTCIDSASTDGPRISDLVSRSDSRELTIVDLRPLDVIDPADAESAAGTGGVLRLVHDAAGEDALRKRRVWLVTRGAQSVDSTGIASVDQAPVWGIGRVVGLEHPDMWGGLIDLDPAAAVESQARELVDIIRHAGDDDQIGVRNGRRFAPRLTRAPKPPSRSLALDARAAYLVTGGLGRLGLKIGRWLADGGARTVALVSRRGVPDRSTWQSSFANPDVERQVRGIQHIEATGARVLVIAADVADREALVHVLHELESVAPLKGIVHAATDWGVVPLAAMTTSQVASMFSAKVTATRLLDELTRDRALDFFMLFSSTAVWGAAGLGHYAAANLYLDAFAHASRQQGRPVTAIDWGAWEGLRLEHEGDEDRYAEIGLNFMPGQLALDAMGGLIADGAVHKAVASIDWSRLKSVFEARRHRPFFDRIDAVRPQDSPDTARPSTTLADIFAADPEDRRDRLAAFVQAEVMRTLKLSAHKAVDHNQGLFEMGMDSLMSVELKGRLEMFMGRSMPSTLTFNYPTIAALAGYLETMIPAVPGARNARPPSQTQTKPFAPKEKPRSQMSEDDLAQLLEARLQKIR